MHDTLEISDNTKTNLSISIIKSRDRTYAINWEPKRSVHSAGDYFTYDSVC